MRTKLVLLDVFAGVFVWAWLCAGATALYFLYGAAASGGSWRDVALAAATMLAAKFVADTLGHNRRQLDYIQKLLHRGYSADDAGAAWRTAHGGGFNLLLSLQQSDTVCVDRPIHRRR